MQYYNFIIIIILNSIFLYLFSLQYFDHPETFKLEPIYPPKIISNVISKCPKIIYQLVPDINHVPSGLYHTILHNINMNPEFEYKIYDYNSAIEVLKKDFTEDDVKAFLSINANEIRTDFIKYAFISKYGGIFLDIKFICFYKFIELLKYNNVYYVQIKRVDDLDLALLASHPDNKAIIKTYNTVLTNIKLHNYSNSIKRISSGSVIRDELFELGFLSDYVLLNIDSDDIVRMKHTQEVILKKYNSYEFENSAYHLLPCIKEDYMDRSLFII
jgi:mannosyltransferase OCH1-like enzyme